jgi:hypothetical protein
MSDPSIERTSYGGVAMRVLRRCLVEAWDLFVDDVTTVSLLLCWIAAAWMLLPLLTLGVWSGPLLFAGLAAIIALRTRG